MVVMVRSGWYKAHVLLGGRGAFARCGKQIRTVWRESRGGRNGYGLRRELSDNAPKRDTSFLQRNEPMLDTSKVAGLVLFASISVALGSLYLVSRDGEEQIRSKEYLSAVPALEVSRRFSTSGSAGAAVTIEAFSVGEQITPEGLLLRYAFDESDLVEKKEDDSNNNGSKATNDKSLKREKSRRKQMQVIGKGAYGRVVRAVDRSTGQNVAMKVVKHTAMSAEALLEEIDVLKRVRGHDNIIHLIDVMYCSGKYYVVTEMCEGGEILDQLITHGPFTERAASKLVNRVASALQHIHKCGYVHLDMKPENIVFAQKNHVEDCRVIDFGMAKKISEVAGKLSMVKGENGARVGTLAYWSPEQVASVVGSDGRNLSDLERTLVKSDPRACDMWALGIVMYIMLLGCHPFDPKGRGDEREMAKAILKGKYRFDIHGDKLRISKEAMDLISGLLDPNPETRYTSTDVLEHPYIVNVLENKKPTHTDTLPTSWTKQGYTVNRDGAEDKLVESAKDDRLQPFASDRSGDAFARVLLMAIGVNGRNVYLENNQGGQQPGETTSDRLFLDAFNMFELEENGRLTPQALERLLRATGDEAEDEVVVSYHLHRDEPVKQSLAQRIFSNRIPSNHNSSNSANNAAKTTSPKGPINQTGITFSEFKAFLRKNDCVTRYFAANEIVFSQGSIPQGFYMLLSGEARLEYKDPATGKGGFSYAKLDPGSMFGEAALIKGAKTRATTVRCTKPSEVLFMPKDLFLRAMAGSPALKEVLFKVAMRQQAKRLHELVEYLKPAGMVVKHLSPGQLLFRQGEKADYMYLIRDGFVGSNTSAPSSRARGAEEMSVKLAERGPGDLIGSSAATGGGGTRYSTAKCITPVTVIGIPIDELTRLRREEPVFRFYLENLIQTRKEFWQSQIADVERGVSEPQLLPLLLKEEDEEEEEDKATATEHSSSTEKQNNNDDQRESEPGDVQLPTKAPATWTESIIGAAGYLNPMYWLGYGSSSSSSSSSSSLSSSSSKTNETNRNNQDINADALSEMVIKKHMIAFEQYARAVANMKHVKFDAGQYVFKKGDKPSKFYIVDSGTVSVEYVSPNGKVLVVAQLGPGDHFGEQVLMENLPEYATSVRCVSNADILAMDKEEFFKLIGDGDTTFALAIRHAMKLRQHRWVRNLLKLAKEDKKTRRIEAQEKQRKMEIKEKEMKHATLSSSHPHAALIEPDEETLSSDHHHFIDRDKAIHKLSSYEEDLAPPTPVAQLSSSNSNKRKGTTSGGVARIILQPGEKLFQKGKSVEAIYMVHRGELDLYDGDGSDGKLASMNGKSTLSPGDTIGIEQCGNGNERHHFTAVCTSPNTIVSVIPKSTLEILIEDHDFVSQNLKRHAKRTVPMNELERRAKIDLRKFDSYSSTMLKATTIHKQKSNSDNNKDKW